jgi:hypothetical protein
MRTIVVGIIALTVGFFFGVEVGYVWVGGGMPETPQTWAVIAFILAVGLVAALTVPRQPQSQGGKK